MNNFFITGLPRSRTSWMANFFTHANTYCFHELSNEAPDYIQIRDILTNRLEEYKGISDCLLPFYFEPLAETLENVRLLVIERDFGEVVESFLKWAKNENYVELQDIIVGQLKKLKEKLDYIKGRYEHMIVNFSELDDVNKMEEIWYYLLPGLRFDSERFELLNKFKIDPVYEKYTRDLKNENVMKIMGEA